MRAPLRSFRWSTTSHFLLAPSFAAAVVLASCLVLAAPAAVLAQPDPENPVGGNMKTPPDWKVRLDQPSDIIRIGDDPETSDIFFVNMVPGWHITTRPAAIFWHPDNIATDIYRFEAEIHLFDPEGQNEGFGIFFGGRDLEGDDIAYDYFLIRNSGEYLIKGRDRSITEVIVDWTPSRAIHTFDETTESSVLNKLVVEVDDEAVHFEINGQRVSRFPRGEVNTEGLVGLRINHFLNVHVSNLRVLQTLGAGRPGGP